MGGDCGRSKGDPGVHLRTSGSAQGGHQRGKTGCLSTRSYSSVYYQHSNAVRTRAEDGTVIQRLSKLELQIMETLWTRGESSIREMQEAFPEESRPAYTTVQTTVYRLEAKKALKRVRKVGNFHMFAAAVSRRSAQRRFIDDLLLLFGGKSQTVMAQLIETGNLTLDDVKEAEKTLRALAPKKSRTGGRSTL